MLKKKLKRANDGLKVTQKVYEEHCLYVGREKQKEYLNMEEEAQTKRGESLRVYELSTTDGKPIAVIFALSLTFFSSPYSGRNPHEVVSSGKTQWANFETGCLAFKRYSSSDVAVSEVVD